MTTFVTAIPHSLIKIAGKTMLQDITNRKDIELLVDTFYGMVMTNPVIGFIFSDVAGIDWGIHLPKMYRFWSSLLLNEQSYSGNPLRIHVHLSKLTPMTEEQFSEWLRLFVETVDELFSGGKADEAKQRARKIASTMLANIRMSAHKSSILFQQDGRTEK